MRLAEPLRCMVAASRLLYFDPEPLEPEVPELPEEPVLPEELGEPMLPPPLADDPDVPLAPEL